ncbi:acetyl-CoA synthetase [Candidatus Marsarchaeota G2 archaeon ECH_B_2]|uniref:Acetyl-CoA synthetase n=3 Tax=Candidatus Marsarchaeota group 2 TaxID=2203771 RepID=A0A2R6B4U4_9ARCH|nr:MAG: acetyl-CoA synthetase [Candidatus Marsarchaeota G2 archaeon ECH_B_2]PSN98009.1 MAG: acetyl-CoA synthetase [Candidatus Marsarchaeota G2 archaeon ECH_B_3]PSO01621.1 MAG: acetyl-CoA synthetase [Candidatus Marsarchaeota G2 archaeon ECH_B_1]
MSIVELYSKFTGALRGGGRLEIESVLGELNKLVLPGRFNWVGDALEPLYGGSSQTALIYRSLQSGQEEKVSYSELLRRAGALVELLCERGIKKGDAVYLMTPVVPEQWYSLLAVFKGGFMGVPSATNLTTYELRYRFSELRPKAVIADYESAPKIDEALGSLGCVKLLVSGRREGWLPLDEVLGESPSIKAEATSPDDPVLSYFTSGTTGMPKRVIHTASSYPLGHMTTAAAIGLKPGNLHCNLSAPGWAKFAWSSFFSPIIAGSATLAVDYRGKLDPQRYLEILDEYGVNTFCAPPTAWRQFVLCDLSKLNFGSLWAAVSAGEPLNPELIRTWRKRFGVPIRDFYGQTETTAMIANMPWDNVVEGSMGRPIPHYDVVLLDDGFKLITRPNVVGVIAVRLSRWRPKALFSHYSDESKNREAFVGEYYITGDKAYFDSEGYWFFVGRADDVIKSADYRIGPFEVESALLEHPAVAEAAVVGSPDPMRWQVVKAYIVLKPGYQPSQELAAQIHDHVQSLLMRHKAPRIIQFVPELPKTISGKIRRNVLRQEEEERRGKEESAQQEYFFR